jgi:hypothetical protein
MTKKKTKKKAPAAKKKIPRQSALPGMGDSRIAAIENTALDYAEIRDQRQELTTQEVKLKEKLIELMHKEGKTEYKRLGISVKLVPEAETVKVRVKEEPEFPASDVEVGTQENPAVEGDA